jgi:hypothetical protein
LLLLLLLLLCCCMIWLSQCLLQVWQLTGDAASKSAACDHVVGA